MRPSKKTEKQQRLPRHASSGERKTRGGSDAVKQNNKDERGVQVSQSYRRHSVKKCTVQVDPLCILRVSNCTVRSKIESCNR